MTVQFPLAQEPPSAALALAALGEEWAASPARPRVAPPVKKAWDDLIEQWILSDVPLPVRKSGGIRGQELLNRHGRYLIVCDNSPAQWAFVQAFTGWTPNMTALRQLIADDGIPFSFVTRRTDESKIKYRMTLARSRNPLNPRGWKLCHAVEVGLKTSESLESVDVDKIYRHVRLLMSPSNMFLVPKKWSGLGEIPEFIEAIRKFDE